MFVSVRCIGSDRFHCLLNILSVTYKNNLKFHQRVYNSCCCVDPLVLDIHLQNLLNLQKPAPIPLATGTTSPTSVMLRSTH